MVSQKTTKRQYCQTARTAFVFLIVSFIRAVLGIALVSIKRQTKNPIEAIEALAQPLPSICLAFV